MASYLHNARLNFIYKLEAITPTCTLVARKFRNVDRIKRGIDPSDPATFGNHSGAARDFTVRRLGSDEDTDITDVIVRWAYHLFETVISYPTVLGLENDIHKIMDMDRHDVIAAWRAHASVTGIPGDASAQTGISRRWRVSDRLDDVGEVWAQVYQFKTKIREVQS